MPTGTVIMWMGSAYNIPEGYLIANGALVSLADYKELFDILNTSGRPPTISNGMFTLPALTSANAHYPRFADVAGLQYLSSLPNIYGGLTSLQAGANGYGPFYQNGTGNAQFTAGSIQWTQNMIFDASVASVTYGRVDALTNRYDLVNPHNFTVIPLIKY